MKDIDMIGNSNTVDWGKRLEEYLNEVSVRGRGKECSKKTLASCVTIVSVLTCLSLTGENVI